MMRRLNDLLSTSRAASRSKENEHGNQRRMNMATKKTTAKKTATKKTAAKKAAPKPWTGRYVIARCRDAGVHAGYIVSTDEHHTVLRDSRRIHYWSGAASLSEIAVYGLNPDKCSTSRIAAVVPSLRLRDSDVCEIIVCTDAGRQSVEGMPAWRA
jgi:hypothetical protein